MGKLEKRRLPVQQSQQDESTAGIVSGICFCERCSMGLSKIRGRFNFKCVVVLLLSLAIFLPVVFWVFPNHTKRSEFDAPENIKLASTVQAYFRLEKPVSDLVPHIARLEYDILGEIAVPYTKVTILSMHGAGVSNQTNVAFGFLPDPIDSSVPPVALSLLKSSLLDMFSQEINLTLTTSIFGQPSSFEILKFPGGITVIPKPFSPFWEPTEVLFKFTLNNSINEIKENFVELKEQLRLALHLSPDENVFVQVTNNNGSTKDPPVTVEASVVSDLSALPLHRLQQLAKIVMGSLPARNLGLDSSVFGKVKQISLSSFLSRTLHAASPTPSPAPEPNGLMWPSEAISPSLSPGPLTKCHYSLPSSRCNRFLSSDDNHHFDLNCGNELTSSLPVMANPPCPSVPISVPCSSISKTPASSSSSPHTPQAAPNLFSHASANPPHLSPTLKKSPGLSPLPTVSYGFSIGQDKGNDKVVS